MRNGSDGGNWGLAVRTRGAVCGLNPYRTAMEVYLDKTSESVEDVDNEAMRQGREFEEYVDNSVLSYYQENLHILPNFVEDFLCYLTGRVGQTMNVIAYECKKARDEMKNTIKLPRYVDAYGVLCAATCIFGNYIAESGWIRRMCKD